MIGIKSMRGLRVTGLLAVAMLGACSAELADEGPESELDSTEQALSSSGFMLKNTNTGRCLTVGSSSGSDAYLAPCNSASSNQRWGFDGGLLKSSASGLCLDIEGASSSVGAAAQVFSCHGGANQDFRFYPSLTPSPAVVTNWYLVVKHSGLCLEYGGAGGYQALQSNRCFAAWNVQF